jgi:archaeosine synthase beta-subunit
MQTEKFAVNTKAYRPIYVEKRTFLGLKDLVVAFYAQKCQFQCTYCNLPINSHPEPLPVDSIIKQVDWILDQHAADLGTFQQLSVGNESSILDQRRFPKEAMDYLMARIQDMTALKVLSLETRPEYISSAVLEDIRRKTKAPIIDVTVGFETQDDHLREVVLNKSIRRTTFESRIKLLGEMGIRLTSYVLLKPSHTMTEEEGIREAVSTIEYLVGICRKFNTDLIIYLNPVYAAKDTPLAKAFLLHHYQPPRIQSVLQVIAMTRSLNVPIYTGLWSEDNEIGSGDYTVHHDYDENIRDALKQYNKTQDFTLFHPYLAPTSSSKRLWDMRPAENCR